ncbi:MAG: hypothetical protein NZ781_11510 [Armatimonadetes bacterium]|nr:hypothetical protein [Armatimonadota bacterium]
MKVSVFGLILVLIISLAEAQPLSLLGEPKDWVAGIDKGGTKMQLSSQNGVFVVDVTADGDTEDFPKIRRTFPKPQDWRLYVRLRAKLRVTCDDPDIHLKALAFVFYDEQTRLPDYPGKPMKQQVIWRSLPVGRWVEIVEWLTEIRRATIRQFDLYLYELPPSKPHKFRWEVAQLELEQIGGETIVFDGLTFTRQQLKGMVTESVGKVATDDGLELLFGKGGEIVQIRLGGKVLGTASENVPTGLLVRDVTRIDEPPKMVGGTVTQKGSEIHQHSKLADLGLEVFATYKSEGNWLEISGHIADLRKEDRAITVYFALPVIRGQWQWWDSVASFRMETDEAGELHYLERGMGYGLNGSHSKYPLGALTLPKQCGLTLAIRMDEPAVHRIVYNPSLGLFYIAIDLGLIPEKRIDGSPLWEAPFRFLLYRHDHEWGFRSALQCYYDFFPQFFVKRVKREGGWYVWGNMAETEGALEAGFAFHWGPRDEKAVKWDNEHGTLALFYIEPQTYQQSHQDFEQQPTFTDVVARLRKLAEGDLEELERVAKTSYRVYPLAHTDGDLKQRIKETAQVVLRSLNYDAFGRPYVSTGRYGWMGNRWGAILSCNLVPALTEGKGWFNIHKIILPALMAMEKVGARYNGIALDSLGGYGNLSYVNYRREHFRYSRLPLSFSAFDQKPVQVAFFTTVEWLKELAAIAQKRGWVLMANCSWGTTPGWLTFAAPYLDIFGAEHPKFADPDFIRAIAYQKSCTDLPYNPRPEWEVAWHLLHGIFPGHGNDLKILRKYAPLLQTLAKAGWQPITGARANPEFVRLERFGEGKEVYLVAHNPTDKPEDVTIQLDSKVLKSFRFLATLLPDKQPLKLKGNTLTLKLAELGTVVVALTPD